MAHKHHNTGLFKVLTADGRPANGGASMDYDLPKNGKPGKWTKPVSWVDCCLSGYHLTPKPERWWGANRRIFVAEGRGRFDISGCAKLAYSSVRLLQEVTPKWRYLDLYPGIRLLLASTGRYAAVDIALEAVSIRGSAKIELEHINSLNIRYSGLHGYRFVDGELYSNWHSVNVSYCTFKNVNFRNSCWHGVIYNNCNFTECTFDSLQLYDCAFIDCRFDRCKFKDNVVFNLCSTLNTRFGPRTLSKKQKKQLKLH